MRFAWVVVGLMIGVVCSAAFCGNRVEAEHNLLVVAWQSEDSWRRQSAASEGREEGLRDQLNACRVAKPESFPPWQTVTVVGSDGLPSQTFYVRCGKK